MYEKQNIINYLICFAIFLIYYTIFIRLCLIIIDYFNKLIKILSSPLRFSNYKSTNSAHHQLFPLMNLL
jgi:hypothetical protein